MWRRILGFFRKVRRLELPIYAAYAAYFLLLSIFPAMMLLVSILQLTPISLDSLRDLLRELVPETVQGDGGQLEDAHQEHHGREDRKSVV